MPDLERDPPTAVREGRLTLDDWRELQERAENGVIVRLLKEAIEAREHGWGARLWSLLDTPMAPALAGGARLGQLMLLLLFLAALTGLGYSAPELLAGIGVAP